MKTNKLQNDKTTKRSNVQSLHAHDGSRGQYFQGFKKQADRKPIEMNYRNLRIYYGVNNLKRGSDYKDGKQVFKADPSKEWYIRYEFLQADKWVPITVRRGLNRIHNLRDKTEAAEALLEVVREELEAGFNPIANSYTRSRENAISQKGFREALEWAVTKTPRKIGERTVQSYNTNIKHWSGALESAGHGTLSISEITKSHLYEAYDILKTKGLAPGTLNDYVTNLSWLFRILYKRGVIESNQAEFLDKQEVGEKKYRPRPDEDELKIIRQELSRTHFGYHLYMTVLYQTAMRPVEVSRLQIHDLDLPALYVRLPANKAKNKKSRNVPVTQATADLLGEHIKEAPKDWYIFGSPITTKSEPTPKECHRNRFTEHWKIIIKDRHGIKKDMYSMKHRRSDDLSKHADEFNKMIAGLMGHSDGGDLVKNVYNQDKSAIDEFIRQHTPEL